MARRTPDNGPGANGAGEGGPRRKKSQVSIHLSQEALAALRIAARQKGGNQSAAMNEILTDVVAPMQRARADGDEVVPAVVYQTGERRGHVRHLEDL